MKQKTFQIYDGQEVVPIIMDDGYASTNIGKINYQQVTRAM
ncbi:hypothetical protein [Enterococcus lemanii]|uniref:Uncharacterized protein n=1 Tax=Enterococcus lemanii TaxID=1159752 RepID=A0ABV9MQX2_9ENTE|nr:hypothetical protein [Enterococcus lemanii]MBM7708883.1 hypothetical protein [Enterococcus lemanii]